MVERGCRLTARLLQKRVDKNKRLRAARERIKRRPRATRNRTRNVCTRAPIDDHDRGGLLHAAPPSPPLAVVITGRCRARSVGHRGRGDDDDDDDR